MVQGPRAKHKASTRSKGIPAEQHVVLDDIHQNRKQRGYHLPSGRRKKLWHQLTAETQQFRTRLASLGHTLSDYWARFPGSSGRGVMKSLGGMTQAEAAKTRGKQITQKLRDFGEVAGLCLLINMFSVLLWLVLALSTMVSTRSGLWRS